MNGSALHLKRNIKYDHSDIENLSGFISSIEKSLFQQLHEYPQSTLKDVYKSFFQDEYGPGHLLEDPERARTAFDQELASMKSRGRREFEPCGRGLHFHRAPLDLVKDGIIEADEYFDAFLDGASEFMLPDKALWEKKWLALLEVLTPMRRSIKNFEQDALEIAKTLERGHWVMHHSRLYRKAYDPHYRIIRVTDPRFSILQVNP